MKLFEHKEFQEVIIRTAASTGVSEQFVEKDYYITEILRIVAGLHGDRTIFKGGTSLSKGWKLTARFSEDIDLFIDPSGFDPPLGEKRIDRTLEELAKEVSQYPALTWLEDGREKHKGKDRSDNFGYETLFDELPGISPTVLLEPGIQSGDFPIEVKSITSLVADFLRDQERLEMADDLEPFSMTLLHFRRTFVEKLFTIHGKVMRLLEDEEPLGRDARHYADLHMLAGLPEVRDMLASVEFAKIRDDCDEKSQTFYKKFYRPPDGLSFHDSQALFPPDDLRERIVVDYERECGRLFPGGEYPSFSSVIGRFQEIRDLL